MLQDIILHQARPGLKQRIQIPKEPFRLLDLPLEIQRLIFAWYYGPWSATLDHERLSMLRSRFHITGVPSTSLLLTCRTIYTIANEIRIIMYTGRLTLNSVFILIPLRKKPEFDWLKKNVRILHFSDSSVRPERWSRYFTNFEKLKRLEIDFPSMIALGDDCLDINAIMRGDNDALLVSNLEPFRIASVSELGEEIDVVISQRYKIRAHLEGVGWKGVLCARIQLLADGAQVMERTHDPDVDIISRRRFMRHEL